MIFLFFDNGEFIEIIKGVDLITAPDNVILEGETFSFIKTLDQCYIYEKCNKYLLNYECPINGENEFDVFHCFDIDRTVESYLIRRYGTLGFSILLNEDGIEPNFVICSEKQIKQMCDKFSYDYDEIMEIFNA